MSSGTDRAREMLKIAEADGCNCDLLALAIRQHESLREKHLSGDDILADSHRRAVEARIYQAWANGCPECLVLLQWEQMWEKTG